ncbi:cofactor assembly of complex C subunit B [Synechococcus sp. HK01-R]|uniref:cofactor assembly of complex C subunit B n=1 Tax=Synechococcus sp. HK01-R TaxID=2751171 RepID=UPI001624588A|nr:cofactor assembly of complex C subunit B [Synechococcus sp. HK01-R]QNG26561.1 cofactor assembly of complex C subunit B [Synechococcus sp. HK01-R]
MPPAARISLSAGLLVLLMAAVNATTAPSIQPSLERAEVLAGLAGVGLMLVAVLWTRAVPKAPEAVALEGDQSFWLVDGLPDPVRLELAWGSQLLLTATSAATMLVYWDGKVLMRRGLICSSPFKPGAICERSTEQGQLISLVKTALYPGRTEFDSVLPDLPAVMVQPLEARGWVVLGGWSERCFSRSDERWFSGWCERLRMTLVQADESSLLTETDPHPG